MRTFFAGVSTPLHAAAYLTGISSRGEKINHLCAQALQWNGRRSILVSLGHAFAKRPLVLPGHKIDDNGS